MGLIRKGVAGEIAGHDGVSGGGTALPAASRSMGEARRAVPAAASWGKQPEKKKRRSPRISVAAMRRRSLGAEVEVGVPVLDLKEHFVLVAAVARVAAMARVAAWGATAGS